MPIEIDLSGSQGNAFSVMGTVRSVLKQVGKSKDEIESVMTDMQSGDYAHLIEVAKTATDGLIEFKGR